MPPIDQGTKNMILIFQKNEITEHFIYEKLSGLEKSKHNQEVLKSISGDERRHYDIWKSFTGEEVKPNKLKIWWYVFIARIFGVTFGLQTFERCFDF